MMTFKFNRDISEDDAIMLELNWRKPTETFGQIEGYNILYGIQNQSLKEHYFNVTEKTDDNYSIRISDIGKKKFIITILSQNP